MYGACSDSGVGDGRNGLESYGREDSCFLRASNDNVTSRDVGRGRGAPSREESSAGASCAKLVEEFTSRTDFSTDLVAVQLVRFCAFRFGHLASTSQVVDNFISTSPFDHVLHSSSILVPFANSGNLRLGSTRATIQHRDCHAQKSSHCFQEVIGRETIGEL